MRETIASILWKFLKHFIEDGWWWTCCGFILVGSQLYILGSVLINPSAAASNKDGYLTLLAVERGCAFSNMVAFASFWVQLPGLIGSQGLTPAHELIDHVIRRLMAKWHRQHHYYRKDSDDDGDDSDASGDDTTKEDSKTINTESSFRRSCDWLRQCFLPFPTIFWVTGGSDLALHCVCAAGFFLSLLLFVMPLLPSLPLLSSFSLTASYFSASLWWICGLLYLSLVHVAGDFLGLQSDSNTVEIDFLLGLTSLLRDTHPKPALMAVRFLVFRKMLGNGICKWYGSPMWTDGTAMTVHYYTQPLPNRLSYYAHHMPIEFHQFSVLMTFVIEVLLPYLVFAPPPLAFCRYIAWVGFANLHLAINTTGNYGFIGLLSFVENLSATDDRLWRFLISKLAMNPAKWQQQPQQMLPFGENWPLLWTSITFGSFVRISAALVLVVYLAVSSVPTLSRASKGRVSMEDWINEPILQRIPELLQDRVQALPGLIKTIYARQRNLRLCNYQGKFGSMHDFRWEVIIEGSYDGKTWREYRWKYKLNRGPNECGRILPFHLPRLDWRVWFLPLYARRGMQPPEWYDVLLEKLMKGQREVVALLETDPFPPDARPKFIRSRLEEFIFAQYGAGDRWWDSQELELDNPLDFVIASRESSKKDD